MTEHLHSRLIGKRLIGFDMAHRGEMDEAFGSRSGATLTSKMGKPTEMGRVPGTKPRLTSKVAVKPPAPSAR